jgi:hypothetical protein
MEEESRGKLSVPWGVDRVDCVDLGQVVRQLHGMGARADGGGGSKMVGG